MTEASRARPSVLPVDRAFVVQFSPETSLSDGRVSGRVEHVHGGRSAHFESLDQLLAFVGQVLRETSIETKGAVNT
jgi:hypothetical protein